MIEESDESSAEPPAQAPRLGVAPGPGWRRVGYGVHAPAGATGLAADLAAWQLTLPSSAVFTHLTSAALRGWWLPMPDDTRPVFVALHQSQPRPRRHELRASRHPDHPPFEDVGGLRIATPVETLVACAADLGLLDLLVLVDAALHAQHCTVAELQAAAAPRRRGAPRLRRAALQADGRAESAWETLLRVLHRVCEVEVEPQHLVVDEHGDHVARADLWIRGTRTIQEYDGADHRDVHRHRQDLRRDRRITRAGWTRHGYSATDLTGRAIGILRDADRALGREHRADRIQAWYTLLRDSSYTQAGASRLRHRLGLADPRSPDSPAA